MSITILKGNIISAPALGELEITEKGYLVATDGSIEGVYQTLPPQFQNVQIGRASCRERVFLDV